MTIEQSILNIDNRVNLAINNPAVIFDIPIESLGVGENGQYDRILNATDLKEVKNGFEEVRQAIKDLGGTLGSINFSDPAFNGTGIKPSGTNPTKQPESPYVYQSELSKLKIGLEKLNPKPEQTGLIGFNQKDIIIDITLPPNPKISNDQSKTIQVKHGYYYSSSTGPNDVDGYEISINGAIFQVPPYKTKDTIDAFSGGIVTIPLVNGEVYKVVTYLEDGGITESYDDFNKKSYYFYDPYNFIHKDEKIDPNLNFGFKIIEIKTSPFTDKNELTKNLTTYENWKVKVAKDYNTKLDAAIKKLIDEQTKIQTDAFKASTEYQNLISQYDTDKLTTFKTTNINSYYNKGVPGYASNGLEYKTELKSDIKFDYSGFSLASYVATSNMVTVSSYASSNPSEADSYGNFLFESKLKSRTHYLTSYLTNIYVFIQNINFTVKQISTRHFNMLTYVKTSGDQKFEALSDLIEAVPGDANSFYFKGTYPYPWYKLTKNNSKTTTTLDDNGNEIAGTEDINFQTLLSLAAVNIKIYDNYFKRTLIQDTKKPLDHGYTVVFSTPNYYIENLLKVKEEVDLISPTFITINPTANKNLYYNDTKTTLAIESSVNAKVLFKYNKSLEYVVINDATTNPNNLNGYFDATKTDDYFYIPQQYNILKLNHPSGNLIYSYYQYIFDLYNVQKKILYIDYKSNLYSIMKTNYYIKDINIAIQIYNAQFSSGYQCELYYWPFANSPYEGIIQVLSNYFDNDTKTWFNQYYEKVPNKFYVNIERLLQGFAFLNDTDKKLNATNESICRIDLPKLNNIVSSSRGTNELCLKITIPNVDVDDSTDYQDNFDIHIPIFLSDIPNITSYQIPSLSEFNNIMNHYVKNKIGTSSKIVTAFDIASYPVEVKKNYVIKNYKLDSGTLKYYLNSNNFKLVMASTKMSTYNGMRLTTGFRKLKAFIDLVDYIFIEEVSGTTKVCYKPVFTDGSNISAMKSDTEFFQYIIQHGLGLSDNVILNTYKFWLAIKDFYGDV